MRDAHRPTENCVHRRSIDFDDLLDFVTRHTALFEDFIPGYLSESRLQLGPIQTMAFEKLLIMRAKFDDPLGDAREQRQIAADVRLHIETRYVAAEQQTFDVARYI